MAKKIKVLIADDSALMRRVLKDIITSDRRLEVVGAARDGQDLIDKAKEMKPDVITLDINMPRMDGMTALGILMKESIAPVIMVSSLTQQGAEVTMQALELGAFDYVAKPGGTVTADMSSVSQDMIRKIKAAASSGVLERLRSRPSRQKPAPRRAASPRPERVRKIAPKPTSSPNHANAFKAVAIGISTGGPKTIFNVLPQLPADLGAAVFIVQHLPPSFTASFASRLNQACAMPCFEAKSGMTVEPGTIYLGQGGRHLNLRRKANGEVVIRTPTRPTHTFMPSVDVMMESVLESFGQDTIGVIMTGMGDDGAKAMAMIHEAGGLTIAESEESAVVWGMPGAAVALNAVQIEAPSWEIAEQIIKALA